MKSNVCRIDNGTKDLAAILRESEKVAVYNELTHKQAMQLRLLCEEIDGMLPNIIDDFDGELWIDFDDGVCEDCGYQRGITDLLVQENVIVWKNGKKNDINCIIGIDCYFCSGNNLF